MANGFIGWNIVYFVIILILSIFPFSAREGESFRMQLYLW
jgi:hypothetical protein